VEFLVLFSNLLANVLQQGLVCIVLHTDKFAKNRQIEAISLALVGAAIQDVSNTERIPNYLQKVFVRLNLIVCVHDVFVEVIYYFFFLLPLALELPNFQSVQQTGWLAKLQHILLTFFPNFAWLQLFFFQIF